MYKILKDKGNNATITLENTETHAQVNLDGLTMDLIKILEGEGYTFESEDEGKYLRYKDQWDISVSDDAGKAIGALAMPIRKPIRDQRKVTREERVIQKAKEEKQPVDVFDLIFGTN